MRLLASACHDRRQGWLHRLVPPACLPALQVNDLQWTWACFVDLAAGCVFAAELCLGFHCSYMASNAGQNREVRAPGVTQQQHPVKTCHRPLAHLSSIRLSTQHA